MDVIKSNWKAVKFQILKHQQVDASLDKMYRKGLVFRYIKDGKAKYGAVPFIEGVWEYQVKNMDRELAQMFED